MIRFLRRRPLSPTRETNAAPIYKQVTYIQRGPKRRQGGESSVKRINKQKKKTGILVNYELYRGALTSLGLAAFRAAC